MRISSFVGHCLLPAVLGLGQIEAAPLPDVSTPRRPVTNTYHGVHVVDDYQWLEPSTNAAVHEWTRQQNGRTQSYLDSLAFRNGLAQQLEEIMLEESAAHFGLEQKGGRTFALRFKPPAQQPVLVRLSSVFPPALRKVVFDPNVWNTNGTTTIDWFVPSPNGKVVAVSLSEGGSEEGTLHFFEVESGRPLADRIPRVQYPTGGGSAAWNPEGSGIFYTRFPRRGERPEADLNFFQQVWFHRLGSPDNADTYEIGREFPRIAEIELESSEDGRYLLATVANGDGGDYAHYLREPAGAWRQLTRFEDGVKRIEFGRDGALYLLSKDQAPRGKILRLSPERAGLQHATTVIPESKAVLQGFESARTGLYVVDMQGGPSRLRFHPAAGGRPREVPILPVSSVFGGRSWHGDELLFVNMNHVDPGGWFAWRPEDKAPRRTALQNSSPVSFADIESVQEWATSRDGTRVPMSVLRRKGLNLEGDHPTLLTGYGGYGISLTPYFDSTRRLWFDAGGVIAIANLRGGGEFGEAWHKAGNLTKKQNVFDDFIACAAHLTQKKYTRPEKLAVEGGSNGGLLMGAFLTQRPDLARAVVSHVGIYDMLRVELDPNGEFNTTEFGSVKDPEQFRALYAYSPFHRVREGTIYPAVLLAHGENDGRVNPAHSRKMTARLQAAARPGRPVLLRMSSGTGHGIGSPLKEQIALQADVFAFLFDQLEVDVSRWKFE